MNVLYEDNHIIVAIKPVNVPSQEDKTGDKDMLTMIKEYIKEKYNKPGNVYIGLVHRLDRPVGGIMVFARTSKAASRLSEEVRNKSFNKKSLMVNLMKNLVLLWIICGKIKKIIRVMLLKNLKKVLKRLN